MTTLQDDRIAELQRANAMLIAERDAAVARETALAEVLEVINRSNGDIGPVFEAVLERAMRHCAIGFGLAYRWDGNHFHLAGARGVPPELTAFRRTGPIVVEPGSSADRLLTSRRPVNIADFRDEATYREGSASGRAIADLGGARSTLLVPLLHDGAVIGLITVFRQEVRPFEEADIALMESFAAQAVIAMENARLLGELRSRTADLQRSVEYQAATIDVLKVMSASTADTQPVFDVILRHAMGLSDAVFGGFYEYDGELMHFRAWRGFSEGQLEAVRRQFPRPPSRATVAERAILEGRVVYVRDYAADPDIAAATRELGLGSVLAVPLLRDGTAIGTINWASPRADGFTDAQIELLKTFAEQAVIAMGTTATFRALQDRTGELQEALERQTATADILKVINTAQGDLAPVFDAILEKAHLLCGATIGSLMRYDGALFHAAATRGFPPSAEAVMQHPIPPTPRHRELMDGGRFVHVTDLAGDPSAGSGVTRALLADTGVRTLLMVPLRQDDAFLGFISAFRDGVRPFAEREIALLESFAAQAAIAMENARLLTETREALEQQTATAEVLAVINANPGNLSPVFDTILEKAMRLCSAAFGLMYLADGERMRGVATNGIPADLAAFRAANPMVGTPEGPMARLRQTRRAVHIDDWRDEDVFKSGTPNAIALAEQGGARTVLLVPLCKDADVSGAITIYRQEVRAFSAKEIALLENFAAQAVIAMENARLLTEQREALERQTATAEVLSIINANPGNLAPVFDAMLDKAMTLCGVAFGILRRFDGEQLHILATRGVPAAYVEFMGGRSTTPLGGLADALATGRPLMRLDLREAELYQAGQADVRALADLGGARTVLSLPLVKDQESVGLFTFFRHEVRAFTDKQIALLESFAAQAVIAMENARLLSELRVRDEDNRRLIARQSASIEILKTISASPDDPQPVFDMIARRARELCGAEAASVSEFDGNLHHMRVMIGHDAEAVARLMASFPRALEKTTLHGATILAGEVLHVRDYASDAAFKAASSLQLGNAASAVGVPLRSDGRVIGAIGLSRSELGGFDDEAVALVESFAEQAVIAISSAKALRALRARTEELAQSQEELSVTFENMNDGVALFDDHHRLVAWNGNFLRILDLPEGTLSQGLAFADYIRILAQRGEFGADANADEQVRRVLALAGQRRAFERSRPDGRTVEVRNNPVGDGGFVVIYADITERKRAEAEIAAARDAAEQATRTIEAAFRDLKIAQANLIQAEKMASLGQLTAGIAHEIKNPLNFVNNFSDLSVELLGELTEAIAPTLAGLDADTRADVEDITATLTSNLQKITQHGKRADGIVRAMLEHSRGSSGERRAVDLNAEVEEALNLAFHGARAQNQGFNITLERDYAEGMAPITLTPQDITRVFLNLFNNGFYAATKRKAAGEPGFAPTLKVTTRDLGDSVEIRVRDNGTGIPPEIRDKLFQPFFTTKPTGEGTGLGLSISYDVVTKQHGGTITVDSAPGVFTEFTVTLPRTTQRTAA